MMGRRSVPAASSMVTVLLALAAGAVLIAVTPIDARVVNAPVLNITCDANQQVGQNKDEIRVNGCRDIEGFPDTGSDDFTPCCNVVSACYRICHVQKNECDMLARKCAQSLCGATRERQGKCVGAQKVFQSSHLLRRGTFEKLQNEHCGCVHGSEAAKVLVDHITQIVNRAVSREANAKTIIGKAQHRILNLAPDEVAASGSKTLLDIVKSHTKGIRDIGKSDGGTGDTKSKARRKAEEKRMKLSKRGKRSEEDDDDDDDDL